MPIKRFVIIGLMCLIAPLAFAKGSISPIVSVGHNPTNNIYAHIDLTGEIKIQNFTAFFATGLTTQSNEKIDWHGLHINFNYLFEIPKLPLKLDIGYLYNPYFSYNLAEHSWYLSLAYMHKHVNVMLGYMIRLNEDGDTKTSFGEYANILYDVTAFVWPYDNPYNLSFSIRNVDELFIGRPTDVLFAVRGSYSYPENVKYFLEAQYRGAGVGNILFDYYDCKLKLGVTWSW